MKDVHQGAISYKSLEYRRMVGFHFLLFDWCLFDSLFKWICIILEKQKTLEIKQFKVECLKSYLFCFFLYALGHKPEKLYCVVWCEGLGAEWDRVWYCIVLCCVVLHCTALHWTVLYCIALYRTVTGAGSLFPRRQGWKVWESATTWVTVLP